MSSGGIWVARHEGVNVIRLTGDVRLNLCVSFDNFINALFAQENFGPVVFDLRATQGIDSTTLGLIAKIARGAEERHLSQPVAVTSNASIVRLLESMGFEDILQIVEDTAVPDGQLRALRENTVDERKVLDKVLEAHHILAELNYPNKDKFRELIETLEGKC